MIVTEDGIQFNFEADEGKERKMMELLSEYRGPVEIVKGQRYFQSGEAGIRGACIRGDTVSVLIKRGRDIADEHSQLLNAVQAKIPGESRFETALRIINEAHTPTDKRSGDHDG